MDKVGDVITRVRNGCMRKKSYVYVPKTKYILDILDCLEREGFIRGYKEVGLSLCVYLKYKEQIAVIREIKRISKPSRRIYIKSKGLRDYYLRGDLIVFSSSKGVKTNRDLFFEEDQVGGEALFLLR